MKIDSLVPMALTTTQLFGPSATYSGGTLTIQASDFPELANTTDPAKLFAALIRYQNSQTNSLTEDSSIGVTVSNSNFPSFVRENTQISHSYTVALYVPATGSDFDPDDVI